MLDSPVVSYSALVIRKLIDGQNADLHLPKLSAPWVTIAANLAACPPSPTLRTQAFEASLASLPDANGIRAVVFAADLAAEPIFPPEPPDVIEFEGVPPLPQSCQFSASDSVGACPWLEDYLRFSRIWSPRGFEGFHQACGLWLLSVVASGRVQTHLGKARKTPLFLSLIARTSAYAKSTTAGIALATLQRAGLDYLLLPDSSTPQKLLVEMQAVLPDDFAQLEEAGKEWALAKIAFAGQRGWAYEEFGSFIAAMLRRDGPMSDFRGLLRRFDDCPDRFSSSTVMRGLDVVEHPYLALLVSLTPADLAPFAQRGSSLWGDGFLARFAMITPPEGTSQRGRFPKGERVIPKELFDPLQVWHQRLGIPEVTVSSIVSSTSPRAIIKPVTTTTLEFSEAAYEAYYHYDDALSTIALKFASHDLDGSYSRFPEKALRLATLFASLQNSSRVELTHWALAQTITEGWRAGLHHLREQLSTPSFSSECEAEEKILKIIRRFGGATFRQCRQFSRLSVRQIQSVLTGLESAGLIASQPAGKTTKYMLLDEEEASEA